MLMLRVRETQLEYFSAQLTSEFIQSLARRLQQEHPKELSRLALKGSALIACLDRWMVEAERYGITLDNDITFYAQCKLTLGADFGEDDATAWAREILNRTDLDGTMKMTLIAEHMTFRRQRS